MIKEILLKELMKRALLSTGKYVRELHKKFEQVKYFNVELIHNNSAETVNHHLDRCSTWASDITLHGVSKKKATESDYIKLNLSLIPRKDNLTSQTPSILSISGLNELSNNVAILGDPGSGKSTSLKYLYRDLIKRNENLEEPKFPIVIRLRSLNKNEGIYSFIESVLGVVFKVSSHTENKDDTNKIIDEKTRIEREKSRQINELLDSLNLVLFIDGLDEVHPSHFSLIVEDIRELSRSTPRTKIFLTCRSASFSLRIDNMEPLELVGLNDDQIQDFIRKWLKNKESASDLFLKIKGLPYFDSASRPLTLAHLVSIYEKFNDLPKKPKTVYKKIIHLYLEEWNTSRSIIRHSEYTNFEPDRKFEFLSKLAYKLTFEFGYFKFEHSVLEEIYKDISDDFELPKNEYFKVTREIESHTGIIVQSGYESFEFAHKSLQEYLTAEYLNRLHRLPTQALRRKNFPDELALTICLSSNPSEAFCSLIIEVYHKSALNEQNMAAFLHRLILEKPDFTINTSIAIALLYMNYRVNENRNGRIFETEYPSLWSTINQLNNVKKSYRDFQHFYKTKNKLKDDRWHYKWHKQLIDPMIYNLPQLIIIDPYFIPKDLIEYLAPN